MNHPKTPERIKAYVAWLRWKRATEYQPRFELWRQGLTSVGRRVTVGFDWDCKRSKSDVEG